MGVLVESRPRHERDAGVGVEPLGDDARVGEVRIDALRQGFDPLQQQEGGVRAERRADVAELLGAELGEESVLAEVVPPADAAVRRDGGRAARGRRRRAPRPSSWLPSRQAQPYPSARSRPSSSQS